jgi:hypothetical protein
MKNLHLTMFLFVAGALAAAAQTRPFGEGIPKACYAAANASVVQWKAQGKPPEVIERLFQAAIAACSGADAGMAAFSGAANVDYARFGRAMLSNNMPTNLYLALVRDRTRKMRLANGDGSWGQAFLLGDADGDLVPNSKDNCAGTPDLTPTDDQGCPVAGPLPPAPSAESVKKAKSGLGILTSPACDGAPVPETPVPLDANYDTPALNTYTIAVTKVTNQPAGCIVYYELQFRFWFPNSPTYVERDGLELLFRNSENSDITAHTVPRDTFRVIATDIGSRKRLLDLARYYDGRGFRVRAVNGNGLTSPWSEEKRFLKFSKYQPCTSGTCF